MKVIDKFTAQYVSFVIVAECFGSTMSNYYKFFNKMRNGKIYIYLFEFIIDILSLIVILFGTLLYNEMIIINRYGLNKNTKTGLLISGNIEMNNFIYFSDNENEQSSMDDIYPKRSGCRLMKVVILPFTQNCFIILCKGYIHFLM